MFTRNYTNLILFMAISGIFCSSANGQVLINEYSASNLESYVDNYSKYEDWIELYNAGTSAVDLAGYYLSDNPADSTKWEIPAGVIIGPGQFRVFWASGRDIAAGGHVHTNFKLTQTKTNTEYIILSDPSGIIIDQHILELTQLEHSRGRTTDGAGSWSIFTSPTLGSSNSGSTPYLRYAEKPVMNMAAGFYPSLVTIHLSTNEPNSYIHYTTNGTDPTSSSPVFNVVFNIPSTSIVKARVISSDPQVLPGFIEFNTYFINESHELVVLSISAQDLPTLLNGNQSLRPKGTFEFFNKNEVRTTYGYGEFNEHGQDSWVHDQRSIDYITRDEAGYNYAIREKLLSLSDRDEFQRVIIRASGDDNYPGIDSSAHMRDMLIQKYSNKIGLNLDVRKAERCILYVNGQYWGIYSIREKVNDHDFTDYYYNQGKYDLQFIMLWGSTWAEYGGPQAIQDWESLYNYIVFNDMSNPIHYQYVESQYDVTSLVDYIIINSFVVCSDWLNWNVGWWRGLNQAGGHKKWGYILWDEDATFGHYINYTGVPGQNPYVDPCFPESLNKPWQDPEGHITVLNELRDNPGFEQYYISRYIDLINVALNCDSLIPFVDSMASIIEPEMPRHVGRWGGSFTEWESNVVKVKDFITARCNVMQSGFIGCWPLSGPYNLSLSVQPAGTGTIQINSLKLDQFPWNGVYYGTIDIKLKAIQDTSTYVFDHWVLNNHVVYPSNNDPDVILNLTTSDTVIAVFVPNYLSDSLVINEINYNSDPAFDPGDWVEFYNPHPYQLDIGGWIFKDSDDAHEFIFPSNTTIDANGFLVLCADAAMFSSLFPNVTNYIGDMNFGLSGSGELIRLYDNTGLLIDTVHYDDNLPWPPEPDGNGPTLELISPSLDNALASSWISYPDNGSPGIINGPTSGIDQELTDPGIFQCMVLPNPFSFNATFRIYSGKNIDDGELIIWNLLGKEVRRIENIMTNTIEFDKDNLSEGMYLYKFIDNTNKRYTSGKLVVE